MKKNQQGFSLIELLIVVVIIGIISAIAAPNLISTRRAANEASAESSSRVLYNAQTMYYATVGNGDYADDLTTLSKYNLIDVQLATGKKSGFNFVTVKTNRVVGTLEPTFAVGAVPSITTAPMQTGARKFCIATDGVVRSSTTALTTALTTVSDCSYTTVQE